MRGAGAGFQRGPHHRDPTVTAATQGDEVKMVGICEGVEPEGFRVQADGKVQVLVGDFEDSEVLEVAHEAVRAVHAYAPKTDMR
jgi:hypothetical protein